VDCKEIEWDDVDSIIWLRIGTSDRFWWKQQWIFRYYKMWGISFATWGHSRFSRGTM